MMYRNSAVTPLVLLISHVYLANAAFSSPSLLPNVQMETVGNIIQKSTECMRQAGPILFKPSNAREGMINHISKQILKFAKCPAPLLPYCKIGHQLRIIYKFMNKLKNFPGLVEKVMTGPMKCWTDVICLLRDNTIVTQCDNNTSVPKTVENGQSELRVSAQKERVRRPGVYNSHKVFIKKKISYEKSPKQMSPRGETTTLKPMVTKLESDISQPTASPPSPKLVMEPPNPADQSPVAPQTEADSSIYEMNPNLNHLQSDLPWEFPIEMLPAFGLPISSPVMGKASSSTFLPHQSHVGQNPSDPNQTPSKSNERDTRYEMFDHDIQISSNEDSLSLEFSWEPQNTYNFDGTVSSIIPNHQQIIPNPNEINRPQPNNVSGQSQIKVVDHNIQILSNQDSAALDSSWQPENSHTFNGQPPSTLLTHQQSIPDLPESYKDQPNQPTGQSQIEVVDHNVQISSNHASPALNFNKQAIPDLHESSRPEPNHATDQSQTEVVDHNVQIVSNQDSPTLEFSWEPEKTNKVDEQLPFTLPTHQQSIPDLHESFRPEPNHATESQTEVVDHNVQILSNHDSPALDFSWEPEKTNKVDGQLPFTSPTHQQSIPDLHESFRLEPNHATESQTEVVDHNVQILSNRDSPALDFSWEPEKTNKVDGQLPSTLLTQEQSIPDLHESSRRQPDQATDQSQTEVVDHNVQILSNQDSPALDLSWQPEISHKFNGQLPSTLPTLHESSKLQPNQATDQSPTEVVDHNVQIPSNHSPALNSSWQTQDIPSFSNEISWDIEPSYVPSIPKLEMEKQSDSIPQMMQSSQSDVLDEKLVESDSLESPPNPYAFHG